MAGKAPKTTQNQTQRVEPWDAAKPYFTDLYAQAQQALAATPRTPFMGELVAPLNNSQLIANNVFREAAFRPDQAVGAAPTNQLAMDTIAGKYMDPASNPWLAGAVEAARRPLENNLRRVILPSIEDQSIAQGAYGGSGYGTAQGLAISDFTQQALDMANRTYADNYARERAYQMAAPQLFAQAAGLQQQAVQNQLTPGLLLGQVGAQEQAQQQQVLNAELARHQMAQQAPWIGLDQMANILTAGGYNTGQMQGTTTGTAPGKGAGILQGLAGIAGIGASLFPGVGLPLAGLLGAGAASPFAFKWGA